MSRDYVLRPFRAPLELRIDYARELNPQQWAAVTAPPGPALVLAGAGAGKTRTLTYRAAFLLEQGVPADRILLLTFTNKAAREMMKRVADLLGGDLGDLCGGTFHAVGHRILRRHADLLGYPRDFTILDREDASSLIDACLEEGSIDVKATRFPKADVLADLFSLAHNRCQEVRSTLSEQYEYFLPLAAEIERVAVLYEARKQRTGVMDFDDLLGLWLRLLREHPDVREHYQRRFEFVLVDEYQDTNRLQSDLIDLLAARHGNVMAVGDDSQSIYAWRGANFQNILRFSERYPRAVVYTIETNYRSTPEILQVANAAIAANVHQYPKALSAVRKPGAKPVLAVCGDAREQAVFVAQRALELRDEGVNLDRMAVLYRAHFHALELQLELTRRNIPFSITSGIRFFEQAHIKDVAAYLKLVCNPRDELAFKRLVRLLPGVGGRTAERLWKSFEGGVAEVTPRVARALQAGGKQVPPKTAVAWAQLAATLAQVESGAAADTPGTLLRLVLEAEYQDHLKAEYSNYRSRLEDLEQLATFGDTFPTVAEFLAQLALLTNVEAEAQAGADRDSERLRLSTVHQAKGLEFDVVFVIMLCEGLFPSARSLETPEGEEEERRLFYVALTRAKDELYLSYPLMRAMGQPGGSGLQRPSRFLKEVPATLREEWTLHAFGPSGG